MQGSLHIRGDLACAISSLIMRPCHSHNLHHTANECEKGIKKLLFGVEQRESILYHQDNSGQI